MSPIGVLVVKMKEYLLRVVSPVMEMLVCWNTCIMSWGSGKVAFLEAETVYECGVSSLWVRMG